MPLQQLPTHAELTAFFQAHLPPAIGAREVQFHFHTPRHPSYSPVTQLAHRVVLSITPTPGFYTACNGAPSLCFLHRPWDLDRRKLRKGTVVLASHAAFDESLTVGWNVVLAKQLGVDLDSAVCLSGYKGNPDRKIGLVGKIKPKSLSSLVETLRREFQAGEVHLPNSEVGDDVCTTSTIAIMNAFHAEEVERVLEAGGVDGRKVLYVTGAARDYGLEAAAKVGMPAFCVGHRACEEWGIRYLAERLREKFHGFDVVEVLEEEEEKPKKLSPGKTVSADNSAASTIDQEQILDA